MRNLSDSKRVCLFPFKKKFFRHDVYNLTSDFVSDRSFLVANYSKPGQCHIIYCSDGFCRLAGYSRAEVMQRSASCSFLCGPLTSQQAVNGLREALQKGVEKHAEVLYYRKDGECYLFLTNHMLRLTNCQSHVTCRNCQMSGLCKNKLSFHEK